MEPTDLVIDAENVLSESGRYVNSFHTLATVENVYAALINKDATSEVLNTELLKLKNDAATDVLVKVYSSNTRAAYRFNNLVESINYNLDYTDSIVLNKQYFDECIGLSLAIKALEYLKFTNRSNNKTNNPRIIDNQVIESLHGAFAENGARVAEGLYYQYGQAIGKLIDVLFPVKYPDNAIVTTNPDGSVKVELKPKPTLKAIRQW